MKTQLVDSKKDKLDPNEILIIAAHQNKKTAELYKKKAKNSDGISAERLLYTVYVKEIQNPSLVRLQEGNTLFSIAPLPHRVGMASVYNGDTENNLKQNMIEVFVAAQKLGFDFLIFSAEEIKSSYLDAAFAGYKEKNKKMTKKSHNGSALVFIRLCEQRD